jgi:uncharacterized membrane protein YraQ (UPF0718 family)
MEAFELTKWYAREHIVLCLVPALFIAGGISAFVSQAYVMKYFGAEANKFISYSDNRDGRYNDTSSSYRRRG